MASIFPVNKKMRSSAENQAGSEGHWGKEEKAQIAIVERDSVTASCRRVAGQCWGSPLLSGLTCETRPVWTVREFSPATFLCPDTEAKQVLQWVRPGSGFGQMDTTEKGSYDNTKPWNPAWRNRIPSHGIQ